MFQKSCHFWTNPKCHNLSRSWSSSSMPRFLLAKLLDKPCRRKILADGLTKMGVWTHKNWTDKNRNLSSFLFNRQWSCFLRIQKRKTRNKNSQLQHETNHHWRIAKTATSPLQNGQDRGNPGGTPPKQSRKSGGSSKPKVCEVNTSGGVLESRQTPSHQLIYWIDWSSFQGKPMVKRWISPQDGWFYTSDQWGKIQPVST